MNYIKFNEFYITSKSNNISCKQSFVLVESDSSIQLYMSLSTPTDCTIISSHSIIVLLKLHIKIVCDSLKWNWQRLT